MLSKKSSSIVILCQALLSFLVMAHTFAASFECSEKNMAKPIDAFICEQQAVSLLDEQMGSSYQASSKLLSPKSRASFLNSQKAWLTSWPKICMKSLSPATIEQTRSQEFIDCAISEYQQRLPLLEIKKIGKYQTYYVAKYSNVKANKEVVHENFQAVNHLLLYPQADELVSEETETKVYQLNNWIFQSVRQFGLKNRAMLNENNMVSSLESNLAQQTNDIFGLSVMYYYYAFGAHPNTVFKQFHWINSQSKPLSYEDIFTNDGWLDPISKNIMNAFKKRYEGMMLADDLKDIKTAIRDPGHWSFSQEGLTIRFMPYELTAYAAGAPEYLVTPQEIERFLTDFAKSQLNLVSK